MFLLDHHVTHVYSYFLILRYYYINFIIILASGCSYLGTCYRYLLLDCRLDLLIVNSIPDSDLCYNFDTTRI